MNILFKTLILAGSVLIFTNSALANDQKRQGPPSFNMLDLNSDGNVTLQEFSQHKIPRGDHQSVFSLIDQNSDGVISMQELKSHKPPQRKGQKRRQRS